MATYWWIEKGNGRLVGGIRYKYPGSNEVYESGVPALFYKKAEALAHCWPGERVVKVKIVKVEK